TVARRARPGVPRRGVAGTDDDGVRFGIIACRLPGRTAAVAPCFDLASVGIVGPAWRGRIAGDRAFGPGQRTLVPFDKGPHPDFLARVDIAGIKLAHHAEFVARAAMDQHDAPGLFILHDGRSAGHRIADLVVLELLTPDHFPGVLVQRVDAG